MKKPRKKKLEIVKSRAVYDADSGKFQGMRDEFDDYKMMLGVYPSNLITVDVVITPKP